ncbi:MAG: hypothetical protein GEU83_08495 [Pseudonocardiaceae bacterium]|nr:hypothetical protein [Pseudonocardiaceae bacterium]
MAKPYDLVVVGAGSGGITAARTAAGCVPSKALLAAGVDVRIAAAEFVSPSAVAVDGEVLRFRAAVIAIGSEPAVPPIPGLDGAGVVTSDTV